MNIHIADHLSCCTEMDPFSFDSILLYFSIPFFCVCLSSIGRKNEFETRALRFCIIIIIISQARLLNCQAIAKTIIAMTIENCKYNNHNNNRERKVDKISKLC